MSLDLGRRLLAAGAVQPGEVVRALFAAVTGNKPFARALADSSTSARALLARAVEWGENPAIRTVIADTELAARLPPGLPARLLAVPIRQDARTGTLDVAVVDPLDPHVAAELAFHTRGRIRLIAAPLAEIEKALLLIAAPREPLLSTSEYAASPPSVIRAEPSIERPPESRAVIEAIAGAGDDAVPLVRRTHHERPPRLASEPPEAIPLSRRIAAGPASTAPSTTPIELPLDSEPRSEPRPVQMVVDFRAAARAEQVELSTRAKKRKLEPRRPPFPSLTRVLETIDAAADRAALIEAILRGLLTTSVAAALFAPRKGRFVGIGAIGDVEPNRIRTAIIPPTGAVADAISKNERLGTLDPSDDRALYDALGLERFSTVHVLLHPAFVADKAALLLASFGMGDVLESTRRARVLATAAAAALERMLRRG